MRIIKLIKKKLINTCTFLSNNTKTLKFLFKKNFVKKCLLCPKNIQINLRTGKKTGSKLKNFPLNIIIFLGKNINYKNRIPTKFKCILNFNSYYF